MRVLEPEVTDLRHRIDRDNFRGGFFRLLQAVQHPRVIRCRVLADDKNRVSLREISQLYTAFPDADHFIQCRAARFVAHVRAIRQIVGPELADEQLIEKRSLVTRPAAGIKRGRVRCWKGVEFLRNQLERIAPRNRLVMIRAGRLDQRLG